LSSIESATGEQPLSLNNKIPGGGFSQGSLGRDGTDLNPHSKVGLDCNSVRFVLLCGDLKSTYLHFDIKVSSWNDGEGGIIQSHICDNAITLHPVIIFPLFKPLANSSARLDSPTGDLRSSLPARSKTVAERGSLA
jgi:hypothetical protein